MAAMFQYKYVTRGTFAMLKKIPLLGLACRSVPCQRRSYPRVIRNQPNARRPYQVHGRTAMLFFAFWRAQVRAYQVHERTAMLFFAFWRAHPFTARWSSDWILRFLRLVSSRGLGCIQTILYLSLFKELFETNKQILSKKNSHFEGDTVVTCFQPLKLPWHQRIFIWPREIHTCQQFNTHIVTINHIF